MEPQFTPESVEKLVQTQSNVSLRADKATLRAACRTADRRTLELMDSLLVYGCETYFDNISPQTKKLASDYTNNDMTALERCAFDALCMRGDVDLIEWFYARYTPPLRMVHSDNGYSVCMALACGHLAVAELVIAKSGDPPSFLQRSLVDAKAAAAEQNTELGLDDTNDANVLIPVGIHLAIYRNEGSDIAKWVERWGLRAIQIEEDYEPPFDPREYWSDHNWASWGSDAPHTA
jgi:hypothetical protein